MSNFLPCFQFCIVKAPSSAVTQNTCLKLCTWREGEREWESRTFGKATWASSLLKSWFSSDLRNDFAPYAGPRVAVRWFALHSKGFLFAFPWKRSPLSPGFIWGFSVWCKSGLHLEFLMLVQLSEWRLGVPRVFSGALKGQSWPWGSLLPRCPTLVSFMTPVKSSHFGSVFWKICKGHLISGCYLFSW